MSEDLSYEHTIRDGGEGSHLTKKQVRYIERYMRRVLKALRLDYWEVYVAKDLPPEESLLMIEPTDGRRIAMLYVSENWWSREDVDHRTDITHEMLHLAHHDQEEAVRRWLYESDSVSPRERRMVLSQFSMDTERMVDGLSYAIAPFMPKWEG